MNNNDTMPTILLDGYTPPKFVSEYLVAVQGWAERMRDERDAALTAQQNAEVRVVGISVNLPELSGHLDSSESIDTAGNRNAVEAGKVRLIADKPTLTSPDFLHKDIGAQQTLVAFDQMNRMLCEFSRHWKLDGDYLRCRKCNRPHIASAAHKPFAHDSGCKAESGEAHPWRRLIEILRPLYTTPPSGVREGMMRAGVVEYIFTVSGEGVVDTTLCYGRDGVRKAYVDGVCGEDGAEQKDEIESFMEAFDGEDNWGCGTFQHQLYCGQITVIKPDNFHDQAALRPEAERVEQGQVMVPVEPTDAWADRFCYLVNWEPEGTENKFVAGHLHSVTFRELAKGYIAAMLRAAQEGQRMQPEGLGIPSINESKLPDPVGSIQPEAAASLVDTAEGSHEQQQALVGITLRDLCELDPADPESPDTVLVSLQDLQLILDRHYAPTPSGLPEGMLSVLDEWQQIIFDENREPRDRLQSLNVRIDALRAAQEGKR